MTQVLPPEFQALRVVAADLNGVARGKRMPPHMWKKVLDGSTRFPRSVLNLDILGDDIQNSPLVLETGDRDGELMPTDRGPLPMPWLKTPTALAPVWMFDEGNPFEGDPRHALAEVEKRLASLGVTPVVSVEMEFFLLDEVASQKENQGGEILSSAVLDTYDAFLTDLYAGCSAMDIPAGPAISESGIGQFEVTFEHQASALKLADDAWLFKMLVKGLARKHGSRATFMAKPFADTAGSGMHMHCSLLNAAGDNVFDDGSPNGSDLLKHAVAGCLDALAPAMLIFAPHANSYTRFEPGAHAPTGIAWAYENRTAALRIPGGPPKARRIEHRMAGADVNPYLIIAAVLGGMTNGLEDKAAPPAPITGNAYAQDLPSVPTTWHNAITQFEHSTSMARIFPKMLRENLLMTKRQELERFQDRDAVAQRHMYLDRV